MALSMQQLNVVQMNELIHSMNMKAPLKAPLAVWPTAENHSKNKAKPYITENIYQHLHMFIYIFPITNHV